jgi:hypothetical protein
MRRIAAAVTTACAAAVVGLGLFPRGAGADGAPSACGGCPERDDDDWVAAARVAPYAEHGFPADLSKERGRLAVERLGTLGMATLPVSRVLRVKAAFALERADYDLSDPDAVVPGPGRLLEDAFQARVEPSAEVRLGGEWRVALGGILVTQGALGARFEDTTTHGVFGSVRFPLGTRVVRLGGGIETNLDDPWTLFPIVSLSGTSAGKWSLEARGFGVRLGYAANDRVGFGVAGRYDRRDWRLAESDRVPGGVFRDFRVAVGADFEWKPSCDVTIAVAGWWTLDHRVQVDDRDGDTVTRMDADPSFMVSLGLVVRF